jgi:hypothetical protein
MNSIRHIEYLLKSLGFNTIAHFIGKKIKGSFTRMLHVFRIKPAVLQNKTNKPKNHL